MSALLVVLGVLVAVVLVLLFARSLAREVSDVGADMLDLWGI